MSEIDKHKARLAADWSKVFPRKELAIAAPATEPASTSRKSVASPPVIATGAMEKLKGLSLRQPWAEQVMRGEKTVEYRQRPVKHRGRIYIYASSTRYSKDEEEEFAADVGYDIGELPRGVIVGTVEIIDCLEDCGDFEWQLANPQRIEPPVPPMERAQPIWFHPFGRPD